MELKKMTKFRPEYRTQYDFAKTVEVKVPSDIFTTEYRVRPSRNDLVTYRCRRVNESYKSRVIRCSDGEDFF